MPMQTPPEKPDGSPPLAGRYKLEMSLGRGGVADVYRALDRVLGRPVAVKLLRETAGSDKARFITEARTLARLSHSGLVTVLDAGFGADERDVAAPSGTVPGPSREQPFLVMELVDGPTLAQAITDGRLTADDVGSIGVQVAEALAYVHLHDVVHRDVKPGNVLLGGEHRVKLADFGIARLIGDSAGHTRTGQTIGTAAYLAPEQVTGQAVSGATDIYSLGLVLLEALTGRREYSGAPTEAALARLHRPPHIPEGLPHRWRQLLADMTAIEPRERPTAGEVAERLRGQPTGPIPVITEGSPDARTVPLLAAEPETPVGGTRVLTGVVPTSSTPGPPLPVVDRAGDALAKQARVLTDRIRALPPSERGLLATIAVLILFLVVVAVLGNGEDPSSGIPANTPAELREPLQELHVAVNGAAG